MKKPTAVMAITVIAVISIPLAIAFNGAKMAAQESVIATRPAAVEHATEVSVVQVSAGTYQATVTGFGEAQPQYQLTLNAEVGGRVLSLSERFVTGMLVRKDELLATLDAADYRQAEATAKAAVADAELALMEEQRQGEQARSEWQQSGLQGDPDSPLVLREPQLQAAQASLEQARQQLISAQRDLDYTTIRAPFDALVVSRAIQPGSYLQSGTVVATLYSTARLEIAVPLSMRQWQNLPDSTSLDNEKWPVQLTDADGSSQWQGYVDRVTQHIDSDTRQRSLVVAVDTPLSLANPLLAGTFAQVQINGREFDGLWKLPASAITQNETFWLVDDKQQLQSLPAHIVFNDSDSTYIVPPVGMDTASIVMRPLNTYLAGMRVNARGA